MNASATSDRIDYLDAVRAFALLLGIVFHASLSFLPMFIGWAVMDVSTSPIVSGFLLISHSFRMPLFFLVAGYFSHLSFHRKGSGSFLKSRFIRIAIPFVVGWLILRPLLVSGWIMGNASLRGDVDVLAGLKGGFGSLSTLPTGIFAGTHLWFLYYLMAITLATLAIRSALLAFPATRTRATRLGDAAVAWLARSRFSILVLSLPTGLCLWFMRHWGMDTPDQSLAPRFPVAFVYGGFFGFGWLLHRRAEYLPSFSRITLGRCALLVASAVGAVALSGFQMQTARPDYLATRVGFTICYGLMMWSLATLAIGVFRKLCSRSISVVRYVADASFWLYLIHLPIVVWLQVAFAELPLHWSVKLAAISTLAIGASLVLYDLFVRSTAIGQILNGLTKERALFRSIRSPRQEALAPSCATPRKRA